MTNVASTQANSLTIIPVWDHHLSKTTGNHFIVPQMKKKPSKLPATNFYTAEKWETMHLK